MSIKIKYGDITKYNADAIVILANPKPTVCNGVDGLIYELVGKNHIFDIIKKFPFEGWT